jgi:hypothetical protein
LCKRSFCRICRTLNEAHVGHTQLTCVREGEKFSKIRRQNNPVESICRARPLLGCVASNSDWARRFDWGQSATHSGNLTPGVFPGGSSLYGGTGCASFPKAESAETTFESAKQANFHRPGSPFQAYPKDVTIIGVVRYESRETVRRACRQGANGQVV